MWLCIPCLSQAIFASAHCFAISIWLHPLSSLPAAPHRPRRAPPCVPPASPCLPPAPPCLSLAEARTPATSRHARCATPCAPPRPQQTSKLQQLGVRFELQQHKISVEQLDSWIQEVDSDNCSLILTICSCIGRINSARNPDLRQEDIGPVICSDKSSITHQISQFVLRGSLICSTSWSFTRGESSMQQQQRNLEFCLPSSNWSLPNCHYKTVSHRCYAFSIFYNSFFVLLFYLLCELTLIHLPETYPFLVTSTAVSSHSFLPSLLAPLLSSAPMAAVAVNTP